MCICLLCTQNEHRSHDTVSAETQRTVKQKQLGEAQTEIQQRIQERLKEVEELKQAVESLKRSACIEIKESEKIFTELIRSVEKIHTEVIELIGANEKAVVNQAEGRMKKLEQEIAELRRRNTDLKQLSETEDHIHFLQNVQSLCAPPEAGDLPSVTINTDISFGAVRKAVFELKDHIEDFCKGELENLNKTVNEKAVYALGSRRRARTLKVNEKAVYALGSRRRARTLKVNEVAVYCLQDPEPRNRAEFLKYSCQLTLDPNTAHIQLCLSEGNRKVTWGKGQRCSDHPERFDSYAQVLCREGLTGTHCYWEIEWNGEEADIGVTYSGISRKGGDDSCLLGFNDKSWSLCCSGFSYTAQHNNNETAITAPHFPRIGVYLDFNAGILSFYGVSDTMTLLHRFQTTFTEPLYPGFRLDCYDSTVTICQKN
ncbi:tripartite motif-containing protein 16-like protein [Polyodon spathula]|uniref:tripartite motif-containing protein 16-like protein n=1 Tax=Polyodon spathula TaxID=7913 RepID=UPI001B7E4DB0|nr:tripartite motif-containing protein 16-like protein [Polyodon spathula]